MRGRAVGPLPTELVTGHSRGRRQLSIMLQILCAALCLGSVLALSRDGTYYGTPGSGLLGSSYYGSSGYSPYYGGQRRGYNGYGGGYNAYGGGYNAYGGAGYSPYSSGGSTIGGYSGGGYSPYYSSSSFYPGYRYRRSAGSELHRSRRSLLELSTPQRSKRESDVDRELRGAIQRLQQSVELNEAARDLPFYPDYPSNGGNGGGFIPGLPNPNPSRPGFIPGRPNPYPSNWPYNNGGSGSYDPSGDRGSYFQETHSSRDSGATTTGTATDGQ